MTGGWELAVGCCPARGVPAVLAPVDDSVAVPVAAALTSVVSAVPVSVTAAGASTPELVAVPRS